MQRFHKTLADILTKLTKDDTQDWDLFLSQALGAVRFGINEMSEFSPYYMMFGRDVEYYMMFGIDNLLKPKKIDGRRTP